MNDKEYETLKAKITKLSEKWRLRMGLRWWNINYRFNRDTSSDDVSKCAARCTVEWPYKLATIEWFCRAMANDDKEELENTVVHEHVHILLAEMRDYDKDTNHEERCVTDLTSALIWTSERVENLPRNKVK